MALKFCPTCKTLLIPQKRNNFSFVFCKDCGFFEEFNEENDSVVTSEKIHKKAAKGQGVHTGKNEFATYNHVCKKCGYDKAQVIDLGIFYSDEDNLIFLKCGKCGNSERIGRKAT